MYVCWEIGGCASVCQSVSLPVCLFVCLSVGLSVCLSVFMWGDWGMWMCVRGVGVAPLSVCLSVCLFVGLSVGLSVCLSVCRSVSGPVCLCTYVCGGCVLCAWPVDRPSVCPPHHPTPSTP
jgi:hypothetical protein